MDKEMFDYLSKKIKSIKTYFQNESNLNLDSNITSNSSHVCLSLIKRQRLKYPYGNINEVNIPVYSSGEESEMEEISKNEASIKDVIDAMINPFCIYLVKYKEDIPSDAKAYLFIRNIEKWMDAYYLKAYIEYIFKENFEMNSVSISEVRIITNNHENRHGFVFFSNMKDAIKLKAYFSYVSSNSLSLSSKRNEKFECYWAYDISDLKENDFYCVIFRNLPINFVSIEKIKLFCCSLLKTNKEISINETNNHVIYVHKPMKIKKSICSLVCLDSISSCDLICCETNRKYSNNIKAHFHPKSSKINKIKLQYKGFCLGEIFKSEKDDYNQIIPNDYKLKTNSNPDENNQKSNLNEGNSKKEEFSKGISNENLDFEEFNGLEFLFSNNKINDNSQKEDKTKIKASQDSQFKEESINNLKNIKNLIHKSLTNTQKIMIDESEMEKERKRFNYMELVNKDDEIHINDDEKLKIKEIHVSQEELKRYMINNLDEKLNNKVSSSQIYTANKKYYEQKSNEEKIKNDESISKKGISNNISLLLYETKTFLEKENILNPLLIKNKDEYKVKDKAKDKEYYIEKERYKSDNRNNISYSNSYTRGNDAYLKNKRYYSRSKSRSNSRNRSSYYKNRYNNKSKYRSRSRSRSRNNRESRYIERSKERDENEYSKNNKFYSNSYSNRNNTNQSSQLKRINKG